MRAICAAFRPRSGTRKRARTFRWGISRRHDERRHLAARAAAAHPKLVRRAVVGGSAELGRRPHRLAGDLRQPVLPGLCARRQPAAGAGDLGPLDPRLRVAGHAVLARAQPLPRPRDLRQRAAADGKLALCVSRVRDLDAARACDRGRVDRRQAGALRLAPGHARLPYGRAAPAVPRAARDRRLAASRGVGVRSTAGASRAPSALCVACAQMERGTLRRSIVLAALTAAGTISDPLFLLSFTAPVLGVAAYRWRRGTLLRASATAVIAAVLAGVAVGRVLDLFLNREGVPPIEWLGVPAHVRDFILSPGVLAAAAPVTVLLGFGLPLALFLLYPRLRRDRAQPAETADPSGLWWTLAATS